MDARLMQYFLYGNVTRKEKTSIIGRVWSSFLKGRYIAPAQPFIVYEGVVRTASRSI